MAEFEYNAKNQEGCRVTGRIEADDIEEAMAQLAEEGLLVDPQDVILLVGGPDDEEVGRAVLLGDDQASDGVARVGDTPSDEETPAQGIAAVSDDGVENEHAPRLSRRETAQLVETIVDLTSADLPLSAGLRAAADEVPQRRVARAMRRVAAQLDRGVSLDAAISGAGTNVPSHLRGLLLAGLRTGRVAHVLEELVAMDRDQRELRRRIIAALGYPSLLFVLLIVAFVLANIFIVSPFTKIFDEFGVELPGLTLMTIAMMRWIDQSGLWTVLILVGIVFPAFVVLIVIPKNPELQRACYRLPILGPLWKWQSLVDFSRLMHMLLDRKVPMAEALLLTADGLRWSDLAEVSRACAADVERGMSLPDSMAKYREFPASMRPVIESGMRTQQPAEAFGAAADMYRRRAGVDVTLWEAILPPMILVCVAVGVGFLSLAMFLPLIKLISSLT